MSEPSIASSFRVCSTSSPRRTQPRRHVQRDTEADDLALIHSECAGGVNAAKRKQGIEPVDIEQPGEQEPADIGVRADIAYGLVQIGQPFAYGLQKRRSGRFSVGGKQKNRQRENRDPRRRHQRGHANMLGKGLVESEWWNLRFDENQQYEHETGEPAEIAEAPAPTR